MYLLLILQSLYFHWICAIIQPEITLNYVKQGKTNGVVIKSIKEEKESCIYHCLLEKGCNSINFHKKTKQCELLKGHNSNVSFSDDEEWIYYGSAEINKEKNEKVSINCKVRGVVNKAL